MKFYHITDNYIAYLKKFDTKVSDNKNEQRPYVGVVLEIDGIKYYTPFSSPKSKHLKMKNGKDFRKIHQGEYGVINFNNMIPVVDSALIPFNFENESDEKYKRLLQNQYKYIKADMQQIRKVASNLHTLLMKDDAMLSNYEKQVKLRCCNLKILEDAMQTYDDSLLNITSE